MRGDGSFQDLEAVIFPDGASKPAGGGKPAPPQVAQFNNPLTWIVKALRLQSPNPPSALEIAQIIPALDAFQSGWPFATYVAIPNVGASFIGAFGTPNGNAIVPADLNSVQRLLALELSTAGGAGPFNFSLNLGIVQNALGQPSSGAIAQVTLAVGARAVMVDIFQSRDIIVPPGMSLTIASGALAAGQTFSIVGGVIQKIPAGFKP